MNRHPIVVVALQGRLTSVHDSEVISDELKSVILRKSGIILDMRAIQAMDCSGIGTVVTLYRSALETGSRLLLLNLLKDPRQMLEACGLLTILPTTESEEDALAILAPPDCSKLYLERARFVLGTPGRSPRLLQ